ncbi:MAG: CPBP family intramembrane metalloprotease [Chlorobi bacterium]|nr:CPBP family intramembrane metalloprotease [Chlorobiota bacterium]
MKNDKSEKKKLILRTSGLITGGILTCIIVPAIFKILVFKPIISLFVDNETIIKSIVAGLTILILILSYYLFYSFFEKRRISELIISKVHKSILLSFLFGFGLISLVVFILYLSGNYSFVQVNPFSNLLEPFMLFTVMGILEEFIFRGIIFRIIENVSNTIYALIVSSLVFGFIHFANSGFSLFSGIAITLHLGLLTGILFSVTKNIWYPVFLHIGWNFAFVFYGIIVSGADELNTFIEAKLSGPAIITGGEFGPENSIITILLSLIVFMLIYLFNKKNQKISRL